MIKRQFLSKQIRLSIVATGIAIFFVLIKSIIVAVLIVKLRTLELLFTPQINLLLIGLACSIVAALTNFNYLMSWVVGYLFLWFTLIVIEQEILFIMIDRGIITLILYLLIAPIPVSIAALVGAIVGKIFAPIVPRRFKTNL